MTVSSTTINTLGQTIQAGEIDAGAVTTAKIADNAVTGAKIAMGSDVAGDILYYNGTDYVRLAVGSAGQYLSVNSGATAPEWTALATDKITMVGRTNATMFHATSLGGSGAVNFSTQHDELATGATSASRAGGAIHMINNEKNANLQVYDANPTFSCYFRIDSVAGANDTWFGYGWDMAGVPTGATAYVGFGFIIEITAGSPVLSGINIDGTAETKTDLSSFVPVVNTTYLLTAKMTSGTDVKFYVDNVLKGTSTTNLPTTSSAHEFFACATRNRTGDTTSRTVDVGNVVLYWDNTA